MDQTGIPRADKHHDGMIHLTRINRTPLVLNADLIEQIETTPDTFLHLLNGQKLVVLEPAEEIVRKVIEYRRRIFGNPEVLEPGQAVPGSE